MEQIAKIEHGSFLNLAIYQKIVKPEHYMIKFNGFGISVYVLRKLIREEIKLIRFIYLGKGEKKIYLATTKQYVESNFSHIFLDKDKQKFQCGFLLFHLPKFGTLYFQMNQFKQLYKVIV